MEAANHRERESASTRPPSTDQSLHNQDWARVNAPTSFRNYGPAVFQRRGWFGLTLNMRWELSVDGTYPLAATTASSHNRSRSTTRQALSRPACADRRYRRACRVVLSAKRRRCVFGYLTMSVAWRVSVLPWMSPIARFASYRPFTFALLMGRRKLAKPSVAIVALGCETVVVRP